MSFLDLTQKEFLPLCDVLFNIISLAAYFCDIVFDVVMGYALSASGEIKWFIATMSFVFLSLIVEQAVSLRWYLHTVEAQDKSLEKYSTDGKMRRSFLFKRFQLWSIIILHTIQCGILWRYFKLFIPVDLRFVKYEVRDLCMLRLLHAFCESAPMLLIQFYLLWQDSSSKEFNDLNTVSVSLSLFSVCWALASFSKNVRMQNVHRLVLTWLGVIFQFFWRFGTVCARIISLTSYASVYGQGVFLVIFLHWVCMFLWLISPKNVFHGENISRGRKAALFAIIAYVFTFAYINLLEVNHREKMLMFYIVMGLENALLMFVWWVAVSVNPPWYRYKLPLLVMFLFFSGLVFMALYYRFFHVRRLKYESGGRMNTNSSNNSTARLQPGSSRCNDLSLGSKDLIRRHSFSGIYNGSNGMNTAPTDTDTSASQQHSHVNKYRYHGAAPANSHHHGGIPGVFNCRFTNPYMAAMQKRKKKKPTSFIPPPSVGPNANNHNGNTVSNGVANHRNGYDSVPFWCRPLPNTHSHQGGSSENEGSSVGSRVNIQQKLQEKKQKQLAELRVIEEEIKQGKLHQRPRSRTTANAPEPPPPPPPRGKQPPHPAAHRTNTSEILLAPHYLNSSREDVGFQYYDWNNADTAPIYRFCEEDQLLVLMKYQAPSDLDSQMSLPRSYTLPRQFKYCRRPSRSRKVVRAEHFVASTNSSDGDVDSVDENESDASHTVSQLRPLRLNHPHFRSKPETRL
ncbi:LOW QUALITY PROTEIN: uncharacterized protein [Bemisia tabaci]